MRGICSKENDYEWWVGELKTHLVAHGYNEAEVTTQIGKATEQNREDLLIPKIKNKEQVTPLVVTFHPDLPFLTHILRNNQCIIITSPRLWGALPEPPLVAYCRPPNLRDFLVRSAHGQKKETYEGNSQCHQPHGKTCAHIRTGTTFRSTTTGERFQVKATTNCQTRNVVYVIVCTIQYVGKTENTLRVRLMGHWSDIRHKRTEKPVARHLNLVDHSSNNLTIMVIETIHREDAEHRKRKESYSTG